MYLSTGGSNRQDMFCQEGRQWDFDIPPLLCPMGLEQQQEKPTVLG